jgi:RimJ/RimL family protein N-acetyltransferase
LASPPRLRGGGLGRTIVHLLGEEDVLSGESREMRGSHVWLRGFRPSEAEIILDALRVWLPTQVAENEAYWREQTQRRVEQSGGWGDDGLDLAIEVDGVLAGAVQAMAGYYHLPPHVYELGIEFYSEAFRGRRLGTETLRLFLPPLFEEDAAIRVQGHTHLDNKPMIALFDRFGFVREGVLRDYWPLDGRTGDMGLYALTLTDYRERAGGPGASPDPE